MRLMVGPTTAARQTFLVAMFIISVATAGDVIGG